MLIGLWLLASLSGCSSMKVEDYATQGPVFRIEEYFKGSVQAWGMVQDRSGQVRRRFEVDIDGRWEGDEFVLHEIFRYHDGERSTRIWKIRKLDAHRYEGRAEDVDGVAQGAAYGNALNWRYVLKLPIGERTWRIHFDDWMFLHSDDILMNRATLTKFGIRVGEVTLFFRRQDPN